MNGLAASSRIDGGLGDQRVEVGLVQRHRGPTAHRGERLRQRESPGVQRLSDDGALDAAVGEGGDGPQVVEAGHPAGGDHRRVGAFGDTGQQLEVRPVERAVLGDVGDDEARTAFAVKAFQHLPQVTAVGLPAAAAQPVLAVDDLDVQPDGHLVAVLGDRRGRTTAGSPAPRCRG